MKSPRAELLRILEMVPEAGRPETLALVTEFTPQEVLEELRELDRAGLVVLEERDFGAALPYPIELPPLKRYRAEITEAGRLAALEKRTMGEPGTDEQETTKPRR